VQQVLQITFFVIISSKTLMMKIFLNLLPSAVIMYTAQFWKKYQKKRADITLAHKLCKIKVVQIRNFEHFRYF